jgi:hypothetical protein
LDNEQHIEFIHTETKNSSTIRLLREMLRWDDKAANIELNIMAQEIRRRHNLFTIAIRLFIVCLIFANFGTTFSEHFYIFDEDEKESNRLLMLGIKTHIVILFILIIIPVIYFNLTWTIIAVTVYLVLTIIWTLGFFIPVFRRVKKISH